MWEHAGAFIGIPAAIKAAIDITDRIRSGTVRTEQGTAEVESKLQEIREALEAFATDALELAAYKQLHTVTNQFMIDLRETFVLDNPDRQWALKHHSQHVDLIAREWRSVWEGERAGSQFAGLRDDARLMPYLSTMPRDVSERIPAPPWDDYLWDLLRQTQKDIENFARFYDYVIELRGINAVLNNYANRSIVRGINGFDELMDRVRGALESGRGN